MSSLPYQLDVSSGFAPHAHGVHGGLSIIFLSLKMRRSASSVVARVPPRAGVSIRTPYFVRASV